MLIQINEDLFVNPECVSRVYRRQVFKGDDESWQVRIDFDDENFTVIESVTRDKAGEVLGSVVRQVNGEVARQVNRRLLQNCVDVN